MSYDRVLPKPVPLHHESSQVSLPRSTNLLDHKIMNDLPKSHGALPHRPDPIGSGYRFNDRRPSGVPQTHQQMSALGRVKNANGVTKPEQSYQPNKQAGPMLSTKDLSVRERSSSSSGSASPASSAQKDGPAVNWCLCQPDPKIPRPRNAFILYRQHYQAAVVHQNPGLANPEISKIIGGEWRALPEEDKAKWKALALEEKARHHQQYPEYRYQPKRSGRDGNSRGSTAGIGHNPSGQTTCNRCGGRIMNAPSSPMAPFPPEGTPAHRSASISGASSRSLVVAARSSSCREDTKAAPKPVRIDQLESRARRHHEENGDLSPEVKRRRVSHAPLKLGVHPHRDRSPESPYPMSPYSARPDTQPRNMLPMLHPQRPYGGAQGSPHPDPSLKLPPLQTGTPVMTPLTPFSQDGSSVEATVMTIPFLNKIKVLAKISPPLVPSFRETNPVLRGPVIAVDGQDPQLVQIAVEYLERLLKKEHKYQVRVFDGPEIRPPRQASSEGGQMGDATVDYLNTISAWHRISDEVINFVKSASTADSVDGFALDEDSGSGLSPKTIIPRTANLQIHSPAQSSENGSEVSAMSCSTTGAIPVALVPRYQLTTADTFACSIPINDSYAPLDHWQWMASLWRACVGPDITVYIRECSKDELDRAGGNPVDVRLQDARTVILRKVAGTPRELEEKALKRVGFEIEDFLTG